jgi:hypothetical protein
MKIKKKAFEVYLTTGETITVLSEKWEIDYADEKRRIAFQTGESIVAVFMLAGICGFKEAL